MTAKKTASKDEAKRNPFDEAYEGTKNTRNEEPKNVDADTKLTPEVIESAPENVGTEDAKLDIGPSSTAQIDADKADEANKQAEAAKKAEKSSTSTRRTKEEKLADDIDAAKKLLDANGYRTSEVVEDDKPDVVEHESPIDFDTLDFEKLPLSAISGNIVGSVSLNQGAVPTLEIALVNWVGAPPVSIAASQLGDVEYVLKELKKQAKAAKA